MAGFDFSTEDFDDTTTLITMTGSLCRCPATEKLSDAYRAQIEQGKKNMILDLTSVEHVDSTGLGFLVVLNGIADSAGGNLVLHHPTEHVDRVIDFTHLDRVLKVAKTMDEAKGLLAAKG